MMSTGVLLFFLGLIVFGPKKTLEFAQEIGRLIGHFKQSAGRLMDGEEIQVSPLLPRAEPMTNPHQTRESKGK